MMLAGVLQEGNQPEDFPQPLLGSGMKPFPLVQGTWCWGFLIRIQGKRA